MAPKNSIALYRDLLRLIQHMAGTTSPKAIHLRKIVAAQFRANAHVTDPGQLHALRSSAERGLSNYLIFMNSKTDPKVAAHTAEDQVALGTYEDDEHGNLVRVIHPSSSSASSPKLPSSTASSSSSSSSSIRASSSSTVGKIRKPKAATTTNETHKSPHQTTIPTNKGALI